jgi:CRP-like cAMP-binding protein
MTRFLDLLTVRNDAESFQPGEPIFLEGEPGSLLFVLLEGEVDLERAGEHVATVGTGEIFGEAALLGEPRRATTARARTDVRVAPIGPALYLSLAVRAPEITVAVRRAQLRHQPSTSRSRP